MRKSQLEQIFVHQRPLASLRVPSVDCVVSVLFLIFAPKSWMSQYRIEQKQKKFLDVQFFSLKSKVQPKRLKDPVFMFTRSSKLYESKNFSFSDFSALCDFLTPTLLLVFVSEKLFLESEGSPPRDFWRSENFQYFLRNHT